MRSSIQGVISIAVALLAVLASPGPVLEAKSELAPWVEPDFPFFSSTLDARNAHGVAHPDNLSPRGLILNLGHGGWACFDPDLLRMTAIWHGAGVTAKALAPGSYHDPSRKTGGGQSPLPYPDGRVWVANGIYPGWQVGDTPSLVDPRSPAPTPSEVGRGPIDDRLGRFEAVRLVGETAVLVYSVAGTTIHEWVHTDGDSDSRVFTRHFKLSPVPEPLCLCVGYTLDQTPPALLPVTTAEGGLTLTQNGELWFVRVPAGATIREFAVAFTAPGTPRASRTLDPFPASPPKTRWSSDVTTAVTLSPATDAYVMDSIALPLENPWRRGVRPGDVQFLSDGTGLVVTIDGDVWAARGLAHPGKTVRWRRYASGLHEPMTLAIRDDQPFVFDKNGIWRLHDGNGDGEVDTYEMFSNVFGQTADLREFPSGIRLGPNGEFVIAKGGQQAVTQGKHNGSVLRISADGRRAAVLGYGFRQPAIAVHPVTGLVTASDQQGNYVPTTPLFEVRDGRFHGFLPPFAPRDQYPETPVEPLVWIPHAVNASAMSQIWMTTARMGPLNSGLVHIGFNKPELFRVLLNERSSGRQAAVVSLTRAFDFTPLHGSVHPSDGQLYLAGFQVLGWGNVIDTPAGLGRLRYTGAPFTGPTAVEVTEQGALLRFDVELDEEKARDPTRYSVQSWSYRRTPLYGSPQFKADGTPGQDALLPSAAYLSKDKRSVFVAIPGVKPVMQLRLGWSLATVDGMPFEENAYVSLRDLVPFDPQSAGFGNLTIDLRPRSPDPGAAAGLKPTVEGGRRIAHLYACIACHSDEQTSTLARNGPPWRGLYGRAERAVVVDGRKTTLRADEAYLRESILDPAAKIVAGYEKSEFAMPSYAGVLSADEVESLVLYIRSLQ